MEKINKFFGLVASFEPDDILALEGIELENILMAIARQDSEWFEKLVNEKNGAKLTKSTKDLFVNYILDTDLLVDSLVNKECCNIMEATKIRELVVKSADKKEKDSTVNKKQRCETTQPYDATKYLKNAFESEFRGSECKYILGHLISYVRKCAAIWENSSAVYSPFCVVTQSTGFGKTRSMYELAKELVTNFICIRKSKDIGFPPRSSDADIFMASLANQANAEIMIYNWIDATLDRVSLLKETLDPSYSIEEEYRKSQPWTNPQLQVLNSQATINTQPTDECIDALRIKCESVMGKTDNFVNPIVFSIDEADNLLNKKTDQDEFTILRRALRMKFIKLPIVFVLTSTSNSLTSLQIFPDTFSASKRVSTLPPLLPFSWLVFTDCMVPQAYKEDLEAICTYLAPYDPERPKELSKKEIATAKANLDPNRKLQLQSIQPCQPGEEEISRIFKFFKERKPEETFLLYGRPLWAGVLKREPKLPYSKFSSESDISSIAYLAIRTNLLSKFLLVNGPTGCDLVDKLLATLIYVHPETGDVTLRYVSEPVLADVAARKWYENDGLSRMLKNIISSSNSFLVSTDNIGEFVAQIILLLAMDASLRDFKYRFAHEFYMSRSVTVEQFLIKLLGTGGYEKVKASIPDNMKQGLLSFSHFTQKQDKLKIKDVIRDFLGRNSAGLFIPNFSGYDIFIPVVMANGAIGMLLIQAKNQADNFTENKKMIELYKSMDPRKVFKHSTLNLDDDNTISIVMDLVDPKEKGLNTNELIRTLKPEQTANRFMIMGHGPKSYPCVRQNVGEMLDKLLSLGRNPYSVYSNIIQKTAFSGCFNSKYLERIELDRIELYPIKRLETQFNNPINQREKKATREEMMEYQDTESSDSECEETDEESEETESCDE